MSWKQMRSSYKSIAVIGLGFGDEGKGLTVNALAKEPGRKLVVRYSGGQQAGHTVVIDDKLSHIFSSFGSGSFQGADTYWSKYCTFDPVAMQREFNIFKPKNGSPRLYVNKDCPVTTPYEKWYNRTLSRAMKHGTCGMGVGATYKREKAHCSLVANDLLIPSILEMKLNAVRDYYVEKHGMASITIEQLENFINACEFVRESKDVMLNGWWPKSMFRRYEQIIFEGSQGLLLDQNIGFYPHVTPSNTGTKNILELGQEPWVMLVTRAYQTRHGTGPMTNERFDNSFIKDNPKETNVQNTYQGNFRKTMLDLDLLKHGISRDDYINSTDNKTLVVTCLDQMSRFCYTIDGKVINHSDQTSFLKGISQYLKIPNVLACSSPLGIFEEFEF